MEVGMEEKMNKEEKEEEEERIQTNVNVKVIGG